MWCLVQKKYDTDTAASDCAGWERSKNLQQMQGTATSRARHKQILPYPLCEEHTRASSDSNPPAQPPAEHDCWDCCSLLLWQLLVLDLIHQGFVPVTSSTYSHWCITEVLLAPNVSPSTVDRCFWWIRKVFQFFTDIRIEAQLNSAKCIWNYIWFCGEELMVGYSPQILLLHCFVVFVWSCPVF